VARNKAKKNGGTNLNLENHDQTTIFLPSPKWSVSTSHASIHLVKSQGCGNNTGRSHDLSGLVLGVGLGLPPKGLVHKYRRKCVSYPVVTSCCYKISDNTCTDNEGSEWLCTIEDLGSVNATAVYRVDGWVPSAMTESSNALTTSDTGASIDLLAENTSPQPRKGDADCLREFKNKLNHCNTPRFHILPKPPKKCKAGILKNFQGYQQVTSEVPLDVGDIIQFGGVYCRFVRPSFDNTMHSIGSNGDDAKVQSSEPPKPKKDDSSSGTGWSSVCRSKRIDVPSSHWTTARSPKKALPSEHCSSCEDGVDKHDQAQARAVESVQRIAQGENANDDIDLGQVEID
jgi:hypothetical protein